MRGAFRERHERGAGCESRLWRKGSDRRRDVLQFPWCGWSRTNASQAIGPECTPCVSRSQVAREDASGSALSDPAAGRGASKSVKLFACGAQARNCVFGFLCVGPCDKEHTARSGRGGSPSVPHALSGEGRRREDRHSQAGQTIGAMTHVSGAGRAANSCCLTSTLRRACVARRAKQDVSKGEAAKRRGNPARAKRAKLNAAPAAISALILRACSARGWIASLRSQ